MSAHSLEWQSLVDFSLSLRHPQTAHSRTLYAKLARTGWSQQLLSDWL